jgi:hypothetical protein
LQPFSRFLLILTFFYFYFFLFFFTQPQTQNFYFFDSLESPQTHTKHKTHALNLKKMCKKLLQPEVTLDKINISCIEPIPQALVWPTYQQATSQSQPPHLLLPPLQQSLQPPPLALLGSDYLTASTTLHQVSRSRIDTRIDYE